MPTVKELREQAKEAGIEGYSSMKKDELKAALAPDNKYAWSTEAERQAARRQYLEDRRNG